MRGVLSRSASEFGVIWTYWRGEDSARSSHHRRSVPDFPLQGVDGIVVKETCDLFSGRGTSTGSDA